MNQAETAVLLRQFNEWRRGDEDIPQFDPREIGEVIDAAVEMIDRLEAAEAEAIEQARLNGMGAERELTLMAKLEAAEKEREDFALRLVLSDIDKREISEAHNAVTRRLSVLADENTALRAKIAEMEQQEPVVWMQSSHLSSFKNRLCGSQSSYVHCSDLQLCTDFKPLYALPGAKGEEK